MKHCWSISFLRPRSLVNLWSTILLTSVIFFSACGKRAEHRFWLVIDTSAKLDQATTTEVKLTIDDFLRKEIRESKAGIKTLVITEITDPNIATFATVGTEKDIIFKSDSVIDMTKAYGESGTDEKQNIKKFNNFVDKAPGLKELNYLSTLNYQNTDPSKNSSDPVSPVYSTILAIFQKISEMNNAKHSVMIISDFEDNIIDINFAKKGLEYDQKILEEAPYIKSCIQSGSPIINKATTDVTILFIKRRGPRGSEIQHSVPRPALDTARWFFYPNTSKKIKVWDTQTTALPASLTVRDLETNDF